MATLNLQVNASEDDVQRIIGFDLSITTARARVGNFYSDPANFNYSSAHRFTGVSGLSGSTIDVAVYSLHESGGSGSPLTEVSADDREAPTRLTDNAEFDGVTPTTEKVTWDELLTADQYNACPSIVSIIQELADSHDPSEIQIMHLNDSSSEGSINWMNPYSYDGDSGKVAKLDIDYTPGGAPARRIFITPG